MPSHAVSSKKLDFPTYLANNTAVAAARQSSAIAVGRNGGTVSAGITMSLVLKHVLLEVLVSVQLVASPEVFLLIHVLTSSNSQSSSEDCRSAVITTISFMREQRLRLRDAVRSVSIPVGSTSSAVTVANSRPVDGATMPSAGMEAMNTTLTATTILIISL